MNKWMQKIKSGVVYRSRQIFDKVYYPVYRSQISRKVRMIRQKPVIKVAFVLTELGFWKTEQLYLQMKVHPRFDVKLLIAHSVEGEQFYQVLVDYLCEKGYDFIELGSHLSIRDAFHPDLIFYQKPYDVSVPNNLNFRKNLYALFGYINYGFHPINEKWLFDTPLRNYAWRVFFENATTVEASKKLMRNHSVNAVVTGLPMSDDFLNSGEDCVDPWKDCGTPKKRIIWAPHHTIGDFDHKGINYATFFDYADFMLELAHKYEDEIQIAFKPHPILYTRLLEYWSKEKVDGYYQAWANGTNTQLVSGRYVELFMHSDAMIHDCSSFTIEYLYARKPVLYLVKKDGHHTDNLNDFAKEAFSLHYFAANCDEVDRFVRDIIHGEDRRKAERDTFYDQCLLPPNHRTACENIIESILSN